MRMRLICFACLLVFIGCTNDEEQLKIKRDIANLQEQIYQLEHNQSELQKKLDRAASELTEKLDDRTSQARLQDRVSSLRESVDQLLARINDIETRQDQQSRSSTRITTVDTGGGEGDTGTTSVAGSDVEIQYNTAYGDFNRGKYELAALGFEEILNNFPDSPFSEECYYYLGRSQFELSNWSKANNSFSKIIDRYPSSDFVRASMLYQGKCYYKMNSHSKAVSVIQELISKYPGTQEAELGAFFLKKAGYER